MTVRELVSDLFAEHVDRLTTRPVRLQTLVALLEDLEVAEPTTRVAMAGLRREGLFAASRSGRETLYTPTDRLRAVRERRQERLDQRLLPWDGRWRMVIYTVPETDRATRERVRRTLGRHGFGMLAPATWISPQEASLDEVRAELATEPVARLDVLRAQMADADMPSTDLELAQRCWDLDALAAGWRELTGSFREQLAGPCPSGPAALRAHLRSLQAFRLMVGGDPFLPPELRPADWPGQDACDTWSELSSRLADPAREHVATRLAEDVGEVVLAPRAQQDASSLI
ncbi:MAG: hypothetical protein JWQ53_904 [Klenkia sp.]|jgi:phenylacetic acid degradation operon negative regulatory protein|nr:hypothetical protein [Klenkia sp.]